MRKIMQVKEDREPSLPRAEIETLATLKADPSSWSRTKMIDFLLTEGQRAPRRALRAMSTEWLLEACIEEGAGD